MTVRVRFAPSPTGKLHIGSVRTVVFNWLFARQQGGRFVLRIEDTDRERYEPETILEIVEGLRWMGLDWDEGPGLEELARSGVTDAEYAVGGPYGPYIQSERIPLYRRAAQELLARGWAYRCNCPPERLAQVREEQRRAKLPIMYDRRCRDLPPGAISPDEPHVIRLKTPLTGQTVVHDVIKGDLVYENEGIDDQVLVKSDGFPTYHLAVVVDDHHMQITHIARADEWLPSTPKHVLLYQALGWELPVYCHVPLVLGQDGRKLSKRHGATSLAQFRDQGYLPEALFNFLALLGWSPGEGEEREVFTRDELIERFDLFRVSRAPAAFAYDKLDWMNGVYIRSLDVDDLLERLIPFWQQAGYVPAPVPNDVRPRLRQIVLLIQERLKLLTDVTELTDIFFRPIEPPPAEVLIPKGLDAEATRAMLGRVRAALAALDDFAPEPIEATLDALTEELGLKRRQLLSAVRWAVTNKAASPPLFGTLSAMGREEVVKRLEAGCLMLDA